MKDRRSFLKTMAAATTGLLVARPSLTGCRSVTSDRVGDLLPLRMLGATGEKVTMLGLGGAHIGIAMDEPTSEKVIEAAIEGGIRFFDNAYGYAGGLAEERFGKFLIPKYRDISFIMTKTPADIRRGPLIGEHNHYICTEILGMSDEEFVNLMNEEVII